MEQKHSERQDRQQPAGTDEAVRRLPFPEPYAHIYSIRIGDVCYINEAFHR